jgi:hypothetical protein
MNEHRAKIPCPVKELKFHAIASGHRFGAEQRHRPVHSRVVLNTEPFRQGVNVFDVAQAREQIGGRHVRDRARAVHGEPRGHSGFLLGA